MDGTSQTCLSCSKWPWDMTDISLCVLLNVLASETSVFMYSSLGVLWAYVCIPAYISVMVMMMKMMKRRDGGWGGCVGDDKCHLVENRTRLVRRWSLLSSVCAAWANSKENTLLFSLLLPALHTHTHTHTLNNYRELSNKWHKEEWVLLFF